MCSDPIIFCDRYYYVRSLPAVIPYIALIDTALSIFVETKSTHRKVRKVCASEWHVHPYIHTMSCIILLSTRSWIH